MSHVKFQANEMIPWHFRRLVLRKDDEDNEEPEFMEWSQDQAVEDAPLSPGAQNGVLGASHTQAGPSGIARRPVGGPAATSYTANTFGGDTEMQEWRR
jgi:hypothetical protein